jgi:hypothetical protein
MNQKSIFLHNLVANQVLLNDPFDDFRGGAVVPDSVGIDDQNWTRRADPEAIGFCAKDTTGTSFSGLVKPQLLQPIL